MAGLTGVVGLAALGGLAAREQKSGDQDRTSDAQPAVAPQPEAAAGPIDKGAAKGERGAGWSGRDGPPAHRDAGKAAKRVPCDSDKLIEAITYANANQGGVLELAHGCTYELTRAERGDGLPVIRQAITLTGRDTRITRAANVDPFRILHVGRGGHLTLRQVTIKGGQTPADLIALPARPKNLIGPFGGPTPTTKKPAATPQAPAAAKPATPKSAAPKAAAAAAVAGPSDGAGLLVQRGGRADIERSEFSINHSGGNGGAVANFGTTRLTHTLVERNSAAGSGGGVFNAGVLRVEDTRIAGNSAQIGGGGIGNGAPPDGTRRSGGTVWLWRSAISHNRTAGVGGGILDVLGTTTVGQSEVVDNTASEGGGGIVAYHGTRLALQRVLVARNSTDADAGGVAVSLESSAVIEQSVITENVAGGVGAGLYVWLGDVLLRDTEVVANQAVGQDSAGGGIVNNLGRVRLERSKVAQNVSVSAPGGISTNNDGVTIDRASAVTGNRPTNCIGSTIIPDRCFG